MGEDMTHVGLQLWLGLRSGVIAVWRDSEDRVHGGEGREQTTQQTFLCESLPAAPLYFI